jgi:hypothetical protein
MRETEDVEQQHTGGPSFDLPEVGVCLTVQELSGGGGEATCFDAIRARDLSTTSHPGVGMSPGYSYILIITMISLESVFYEGCAQDVVGILRFS